MTTAAYIPTGPLAIAVTVAALLFGALVVFGVYSTVIRWEEKRRLRKRERGLVVPREVTAQFMEDRRL